MEYNKEKREIKLERELSNLDKFVLDFVSLLDEYVIVSGYVSILFGRSRATEDIDLLVPKLNKEDFLKLWEKIYKNNFECINTSNADEALNMLDKHAIRFAKKGMAVPNMEFKIIKTDLDKYAFENKIKVALKKGMLFISPIELQIAYKLFLAADGTDQELQSDKDIEDARHLYKLFKEKIDKKEFSLFLDRLNVKGKLRFLE